MYIGPSNVCDACISVYAFSVCMCEYMRSSCRHLCDKPVQLCMLSGKAYHGSVFEQKGGSSLLAGLLALLYLLCPKPQEKAVGNGRGQQGRITHPPQLGEMVRRRRQLHVRHLRMLMVMCMRGPKLKRRL